MLLKSKNKKENTNVFTWPACINLNKAIEHIYGRESAKSVYNKHISAEVKTFSNGITVIEDSSSNKNNPDSQSLNKGFDHIETPKISMASLSFAIMLKTTTKNSWCNNQDKFIAINRRPVLLNEKSISEVTKGVIDLSKNLINADFNSKRTAIGPGNGNFVYVIQISIPPSYIDVNLSAKKDVVRILNPKIIMDFQSKLELIQKEIINSSLEKNLKIEKIVKPSLPYEKFDSQNIYIPETSRDIDQAILDYLEYGSLESSTILETEKCTEIDNDPKILLETKASVPSVYSAKSSIAESSLNPSSIDEITDKISFDTTSSEKVQKKDGFWVSNMESFDSSDFDDDGIHQNSNNISFKETKTTTKNELETSVNSISSSDAYIESYIMSFENEDKYSNHSSMAEGKCDNHIIFNGLNRINQINEEINDDSMSKFTNRCYEKEQLNEHQELTNIFTNLTKTVDLGYQIQCTKNYKANKFDERARNQFTDAESGLNNEIPINSGDYRHSQKRSPKNSSTRIKPSSRNNRSLNTGEIAHKKKKYDTGYRNEKMNLKNKKLALSSFWFKSPQSFKYDEQRDLRHKNPAPFEPSGEGIDYNIKKKGIYYSICDNPNIYEENPNKESSENEVILSNIHQSGEVDMV
ncbi:hypothetical protein AYI69_g5671 [Smittium culicis]|uniref:DNA mismatch repair protein S5 domain-containing protein n=1 Tax=Smittium culicis TaxID=133412 RepID=A0A1R1Y492_9FUNG|nr:hypothetical protein AYI69_g5671 [Smittium culicis]